MDNEGGEGGHLRHSGARTQAESAQELKQYVQAAQQHEEAEARGEHMMSRAEFAKSMDDAQADYAKAEAQWEQERAANLAKARAEKANLQALAAQKTDEDAAIALAQAQRAQQTANQEALQEKAREKVKPQFKMPNLQGIKDGITSFVKGLFGIRKAA